MKIKQVYNYKQSYMIDINQHQSHQSMGSYKKTDMNNSVQTVPQRTHKRCLNSSRRKTDIHEGV